MIFAPLYEIRTTALDSLYAPVWQAITGAGVQPSYYASGARRAVIICFPLRAKALRGFPFRNYPARVAG